MNFLKYLPAENELVNSQPSDSPVKIHKVNAHIHSPYSFSSFSSIEQAVELAVKEDISVLGINDFFVTDGYAEFYKNCLKSKIFPLFNIEFIALSTEFQQKGIRINDPNNPGRIYFSGKGLDFPECFTEPYKAVVDSCIHESQVQVEAMTQKTNEWLSEINAGISLDFAEIKLKYAKNLVRERHIAKALKDKIFEKYKTENECLEFFGKLYYGNPVVSNLDDSAAVENEIRNRLLKAGGKAFVEENEKAFLNLNSVMDIILNAGGIPCYPVLLDDPKGNITEFEQNPQDLLRELSKRNIFCIELIPVRNDYKILKEFVDYFYGNGFIILFGTEHNSPGFSPLTVSCRNKTPLDAKLEKIAHEGACLIAAHQYQRARGNKSRVMQWPLLNTGERRRLIELGNLVIERFINT